MFLVIDNNGLSSEVSHSCCSHLIWFYIPPSSRSTSPMVHLETVKGNRPLPLQMAFLEFLPPAYEVLGKGMFLQVSVILSTWGNASRIHPPLDVPTLLDTLPSGSLWMNPHSPSDMVNNRAVCILLEYILVRLV